MSLTVADDLCLLPPVGENVVVLSHSEVDAYNDCHKRHEYAHVEKIAPMTLNERIINGTIGHYGLEIYYKSLQNGAPHDVAAEQGLEAILEFLDGEEKGLEFTAHLTQIANVTAWLQRYFEYYKTREQFDILYVEQEFYLHLGNFGGKEAYFACKPDLIVQEPMRRGVTIIDHKFVSRFYSGEAVATMPQMVRYGSLLSRLGLPLHRCMYNEVHTSPAQKNPKYFERFDFQPTLARTTLTWRETVDTVKEILENRSDRRMPGPMKCNFCMFQPLCVTEMNGQNSSVMRRANYRPSKYGYGVNDGD